MRIPFILLLIVFTAACGVKIQGVEIGRLTSTLSNIGEMGSKDEEEEIQLGRDTSQALLKNAKLSSNASLQRYVNQVGYSLIKQSSRPNLPWRFVVLENQSINAFAAPGGYVFITTGMLNSLTNEAALAGVLAHEIAHVLERHHLTTLENKTKRSLLTDLAVLGVQGSQAKNYSESNSASPSKAASAFERSVHTLYEKGLDKQDELDADKVGILLTAKAGYDPFAFIGVLQAIQSRENLQQEELMRFTSTHPDAEHRLTSLEPTLIKLERHELELKVLRERFIARTQY